VAQEAEGCCLNQNTKLDFGETGAKAVFLFILKGISSPRPVRDEDAPKGSPVAKAYGIAPA
jgi:hypothetical protein